MEKISTGKNNWQCPYCNHHTTIHINGRSYGGSNGFIGYADLKKENYQLKMINILCPNIDCNELYLSIALIRITGANEIDKTIKKWNLLPESSSKLFPSYIPEAIIKDYTEACLIKDKSANASATLARRCLQGMVRDFFKLDNNHQTLKKELDNIKDKVDSSVWIAINKVRELGNIGAHMEKDINLIIDVEPGEVEQLIWLLEYLFEKWYIHRHEDNQKLAEISKMTTRKRSSNNSKGEETSSD